MMSGSMEEYVLSGVTDSSLGSETDEIQWSVAFMDSSILDELRRELHTAQSDHPLAHSVDRFAGLKVEVFAREHPPPHFRILCRGESASYQISDCAQISGDLRRHYHVVRAWHSKNKARLIEAWNDFRPSDCPVGLYRED